MLRNWLLLALASTSWALLFDEDFESHLGWDRIDTIPEWSSNLRAGVTPTLQGTAGNPLGAAGSNTATRLSGQGTEATALQGNFQAVTGQPQFAEWYFKSENHTVGQGYIHPSFTCMTRFFRYQSPSAPAASLESFFSFAIYQDVFHARTVTQTLPDDPETTEGPTTFVIEHNTWHRVRVDWDWEAHTYNVTIDDGDREGFFPGREFPGATGDAANKIKPTAVSFVQLLNYGVPGSPTTPIASAWFDQIRVGDDWRPTTTPGPTPATTSGPPTTPATTAVATTAGPPTTTLFPLPDIVDKDPNSVFYYDFDNSGGDIEVGTDFWTSFGRPLKTMPAPSVFYEVLPAGSGLTATSRALSLEGKCPSCQLVNFFGGAAEYKPAFISFYVKSQAPAPAANQVGWWFSMTGPLDVNGSARGFAIFQQGTRLRVETGNEGSVVQLPVFELGRWNRVRLDFDWRARTFRVAINTDGYVSTPLAFPVRTPSFDYVTGVVLHLIDHDPAVHFDRIEVGYDLPTLPLAQAEALEELRVVLDSAADPVAWTQTTAAGLVNTGCCQKGITCNAACSCYGASCASCLCEPKESGFMLAVKKIGRRATLKAGQPWGAWLSKLSALEELRIGGIQSTIPAAFGTLTSLKVLEIEPNQLTGEIPGALSALTALEEVSIGRATVGRGLTGALPSWLLQLPNLHTLNITDNGLTGSLPTSFSSSLKVIRLNGNALGGSVPAALGSTPGLALTDLFLQQTNSSFLCPVPDYDQFVTVPASGHSDYSAVAPCSYTPAPTPSTPSPTPVPSPAPTPSTPSPTPSPTPTTPQPTPAPTPISRVLPVREAEALELLRPVFEDDLDPLEWSHTSSADLIEYGCCQKSITCNADCACTVPCANQASGQPCTCDTCTCTNLRAGESLHVIKLERDSVLKGPDAIGEWFGNFTELEELKVGSTLVRLPPSVGRLKKLQTFEVVPSALTGSIPDTYAGLTSLRKLRVTPSVATGLTGDLPHWLFQLPNIENIELHDNDLTGSLPETMSHSLKVLYLSDNRLSGRIPPVLGNLSLTHLFLEQLAGFPFLCPIPDYDLFVEAPGTLHTDYSGAMACLHTPSPTPVPTLPTPVPTPAPTPASSHLRIHAFLDASKYDVMTNFTMHGALRLAAGLLAAPGQASSFLAVELEAFTPNVACPASGSGALVCVKATMLVSKLQLGVLFSRTLGQARDAIMADLATPSPAGKIANAIGSVDGSPDGVLSIGGAFYEYATVGPSTPVDLDPDNAASIAGAKLSVQLRANATELLADAAFMVGLRYAITDSAHFQLNPWLVKNLTLGPQVGCASALTAEPLCTAVDFIITRDDLPLGEEFIALIAALYSKLTHPSGALMGVYGDAETGGLVWTGSGSATIEWIPVDLVESHLAFKFQLQPSALVTPESSTVISKLRQVVAEEIDVAFDADLLGDLEISQLPLVDCITLVPAQANCQNVELAILPIGLPSGMNLSVAASKLKEAFWPPFTQGTPVVDYSGQGQPSGPIWLGDGDPAVIRASNIVQADVQLLPRGVVQRPSTWVQWANVTFLLTLPRAGVESSRAALESSIVSRMRTASPTFSAERLSGFHVGAAEPCGSFSCSPVTVTLRSRPADTTAVKLSVLQAAGLLRAAITHETGAGSLGTLPGFTGVLYRQGDAVVSELQERDEFVFPDFSWASDPDGKTETGVAPDRSPELVNLIGVVVATMIVSRSRY